MRKRRPEWRWAAALGVALFLLCGVRSFAEERPGEWTQFRQNPRNNAVVASDLRAKWRIETGFSFSSSPSVSGTTLFIGNNGGELYAVDLRNGNVRWQKRVSAPLMSNPILWKNLVIVGEGNQNSFNGDDVHPVIVGNGENALIAYDAKTGEERWQLPLHGSGMPTAAIVHGMLLHHDGSGEFIAADPATGQVTYRRDLKSVASMSAILPIGNGTVVTNGMQPTAVQALDVRTGNPVWSYAFDASASGVGDCPAAAGNGYIVCDYVSATHGAALHVGDDAVEHAYALSATSGTLLWDTKFDDAGTLPQGNESAIPLVSGGTAFIGSAVAPAMNAINTATGKVLWHLVVRGPVKDGPVEKNGAIYFGDLGGYLWAVDAATGNAIGRKNVGVPFNVGSPVIVGNTLVIGSQTGALIALPLDEVRRSQDG